jgi:hypothetical protein
MTLLPLRLIFCYQEDDDCPRFFQLGVDVSVVYGKEGADQLRNVYKNKR